MKERPILFSAPMVRAILEGRKTQTRRIIKPSWARCLDPDEDDDRESIRVGCPYGQPGDRLWVRETWGLRNCESDPTDWERASVAGCSEDEIREQYHLDFRADWGPLQEGCFWRPAIHMPRWASRITLEVTGVRVERLHAITDEDAKAEGVEPFTPPHGHISPDQRVPGPGFDHVRLGDQPHRLPFADLWEKINGAESWDANPWVWVVEFRRVEAQERAA